MLLNPRTWAQLGQDAFSALRVSARRPYPSRTEFRNSLLLAALVVSAAILVIWLLTTEPIGWLPKTSEVNTLLVGLLSAQAAIAALTLAVTLFVMQGVSTRRDADDRIYGEYIHRSRVRLVFSSSICAVFITGGVLTIQAAVGDAATSVRNLTPLAVAGFVANLAFAVVLFEQAIRLANPEHWRNLRMYVNERDVRQAVRVYISRLQRAIGTRQAGELDWSVMFPAAGEGSANQAIQALLDDARRAMAERRQQEFKGSLDSIKELIEDAMDEMERAGMSWGDPGGQREWPPLGELGRNLYAFREEVIHEGRRECLSELLALDYWLASNGTRRACGELFTVGLNGYRWNYLIATRISGGDIQELLRDDFSLHLNSFILGGDPDKSLPYLEEITNQQERMLSDAMHANRPEDYKHLHVGFNSRFRDAVRYREFDDTLSPGQIQQGGMLAAWYRIALMNLAGRSIFLAETAKIPNATPYLEMAKGTYPETRELADDIVIAFDNERRWGFSLWHEWERQDDPHSMGGFIDLQKYRLAFFAVRLMELAEGETLTLNLHGNAKRVFDWFLANSTRFERFVYETPELSTSRRREIATAILHKAVHRDEIEEDHKIMRRELSNERIATFKSGVDSEALGNNPIERLFERVGKIVRLAGDAENVPEERGFFRRLFPKAPFTDGEENDRISYAPVEGGQWGRGLSRDEVQLLCEGLEHAAPITSELDSLETMLRAIDVAVEDLAPNGDVAIVLAGDWREIVRVSYGQEPHGYEPFWRMTERDSIGELARYNSYPILRGPETGDRRLYVVYPCTWGCFVRAQFDDGNDIRVEVNPISTERAQEYLQANPDHFPDEPDDESKLRKLQTLVEVDIGVRHGFRVIDPTRARRITPTEPSTESSC